MENRLRNLRKAMERSTFNNLHFSENLKHDIQKEVSHQHESSEEIVKALLQLLVNEKNGYELVKLLRARGIKKFEENEGSLYTLLHRLEVKGCLMTRWDKQSAKYYQLTKKGKKLIHSSERKSSQPIIQLSELLEG
ncbi:PadR family transcriptional regulator [Bacillus spongiae]|uniref:PadR family transcriptional regulator n=1 Tax=Bacillus spongiae TaxID=2683610 RepID=A0ABU8H8L9_9BACI